MHTLNSATIGIDHGDVMIFSDFEDDGSMWRGEGPRERRKSVSFSRKYNNTPHIQLSISMWDISNSNNSRVDLEAVNVTESDFEIVFRTWSDTQVARVRVGWTAIGDFGADEGWDV